MFAETVSERWNPKHRGLSHLPRSCAWEVADLGFKLEYSLMTDSIKAVTEGPSAFRR